MSFLEEIIATKRQQVEAAKNSSTLEKVRQGALHSRANAGSHRLFEALEHDGVNIIAEFKRRSPSKGVIRADASPANVATTYEKGGAVAISVLTEENYFAGSLDDLREVKAAVKLPVLRKDFIFDEFQIYESALAGADALLLIVSALDDATLRSLRRMTEDDLGMDALVEVHDAAEMERAITAGSRLIGVNNRNLHTFDVSLATSLELGRLAPKDSVLISESGIRNSTDVVRLRNAGCQGFLIGESLMRAENPEFALRDLIAGGS